VRVSIPDDSVGPGRSTPLTVLVDGVPVLGAVGMTIAGVMLADGRSTWRTSRRGRPRGIFCGIGVCHDCLLTVNGLADVRACQRRATDGDVITTDSAPADTTRPAAARPDSPKTAVTPADTASTPDTITELLHTNAAPAEVEVSELSANASAPGAAGIDANSAGAGASPGADTSAGADAAEAEAGPTAAEAGTADSAAALGAPGGEARVAHAETDAAGAGADAARSAPNAAGAGANVARAGAGSAQPRAEAAGAGVGSAQRGAETAGAGAAEGDASERGEAR
jgi:D-hydroxyproline dehydrogenase subunit gamma